MLLKRPSAYNMYLFNLQIANHKFIKTNKNKNKIKKIKMAVPPPPNSMIDHYPKQAE